MNLRKILHLHFYKDEIILGIYNPKTQEVPAILREKCKYCGKIRNELKGYWQIPVEETLKLKGQNDGTKRFVGSETAVDGEVS